MLQQGQPDTDLSPLNIRLLLVAFFALGLLQILNHPLWQDEWQAWLLAKDSRSLADLFHNLRYEGHPALWYLALFGLSRATAHPLAMQLLHLGLATGAVYLVLRFSPFTRLQKILFTFGYFPFFEYAVISRNYAAGIFLIFAFCALFPRAFPRKYPVLAGLLFLLCQTSIYGLLVALALGAALLIGGLTARPHKPLPAKADLITAGLILGAGVLASIWQLLPAPDSGFAAGWRFSPDWPAAVRSLNTVWESYVPLPSFQMHFWNTNFIGQPYLKFCLALLLLGLACWRFRRQPAVLLWFSLGTLALLSFTYTKYFGSIRHHGHLFILFLAACWLSPDFPVRPGQPGNRGHLGGVGGPPRQGLITALLAVQLTAGLLAAGLAFYYPFSAGRETAHYIRVSGLDYRLIAGEADDAASVVSGYLHRQIFYLCSNRWGTFVIWDRQRKTLEIPEVLQRARELAASYRQEVLLVLNREIKTPEANLSLIRQFPRSIVPAEGFYLSMLK